MPAGSPADPLEPIADLPRIPNGRREKKDLHSRRQVDQDLLPNHSPVLIPQVVGFVQDHQVHFEVFPSMHGVVELIAQDFRGAHNDLGMEVFLSVPRQDPTCSGPKIPENSSYLALDRALSGEAYQDLPPERAVRRMASTAM